MEFEKQIMQSDDRAIAQAKLAAVVESSDDAIVSKTLDGIVTTWNAGAQRIFGYTPEEMIGQSITRIIPPDRAGEEPQILARIRAGERIEHFESIRVTKDGRKIDVSVTISPIKNEQGQIIGASKIARDITEAKQLHRELREAKDAAEAASRAKDQFLSVLSHELRTPLTPVLFSLSALEERTDLPREVREEIAMARRNVEAESRLVDDLLDLTRISRNKMKLHLEVVDIYRILRMALQVVQDQIDSKGIDVSFSLRAKQHHVWADPGRLQQVFLNLLSNAAKFTPEGGSITLRAANTDLDRVVIQIRDTGMGIEPEVLARLFQPFEQGELVVSRKFGGLGLGLSIARSLAELHGGTLFAESEGRGKGATFSVAMTTVAPPHYSRDPEQNLDLHLDRQLRILLVEDHIDTRDVITRLLIRLGCTVTAASTVREALSLGKLNGFDLLISDIGLPDGSGLDVMRGLRAQSPIKGIALSGYGQAEDLRRSQEAGFSAHLTKPINFHLLEKTIQELAVA